MTDAGVVIIFLWFGVGALLFAAIPGLRFGLTDRAVSETPRS